MTNDPPVLPALPDREAFASELTAVRQRAGLTIREIAAKLDIPAATLGGYFGGGHLPPLRQPSVLTAILAVCGVSDRAAVTHWEAALQRLRRIPGPRPAGTPAPYRGLACFGPDDAEWFHGRETLIAELAAALPAPEAGPLMVVGPSGSGKSSLLQAGLVPVLRGRGLEATVCRPAQAGLAQAGRGVLIVDPLEELFTGAAAGEQDAVLAAIAAWPGPVVLAMRSDFYDQALRHPYLAEALQHRQLIVGPMSETELRQAIVEPARRARVELEAGLVELLLRDGRSAPAGTALPLLSHALLSTWERSERNRMRVDHYHATGGIERAVAATADAEYENLTEAQQRFIRRALLRLVHPDEALLTRRRVSRAELPSGGADEQAALAGFIDRRLLTVDGDQIEITHEALLSAWPQLREWIDADRADIRAHRQLTTAATVWAESGHDLHSLLRGVRLTMVRDWAAEHDADLNDLERHYVKLSIAQEQQELNAARRRTRLLTALLAVTAVLAVIAGAAAVYAFQQRNDADRQRDLAVSRELAITADQLRTTDTALAAQLALTAYQVSPTQQARSSLLGAYAGPAATRLVGPTGVVQAAATSPDDRTVAMAAVDHTIRLWNTASTRPLGPPLTGHTRTVFAAAFRPDGRLLATAGADRAIRFWDIGTDRGTAHSAVESASVNTIYALAFHPAGQLLAAGSADGTLTLWQVSDDGPASRVATVTTPGVAVHTVAISPDGRLLATGSADNAVRLYDISQPATPTAYPVPALATRKVLSVAFSRDSRLLAAGGADNTVRLWDVTNPGRPTPRGAPLTGPTGWVNAVAFSPDGRLVAAGSSDEKTWLWHTDTGVAAGTLPHPAQVASVHFTKPSTAAGSILTTAAFDGALRRWALPGPIITGPAAPVFNALPAGPRPVTLIAASDDAFSVWETTDPRRPRQLTLVAGAGVTSRSTGAANISPDTHTVAIGTAGDVQLWDVTDPGNAVFRATLHGHTAPIQAVTFSPDSRTLATASDDHTAMLWDITDPANPTRRGPPLAADNIVYSPVFSPDGRILAVGTADNTVLLWDIHDPADPSLLHPPLRGATSPVFAVAFSPDGHTLATADNAIRLWDITDPARPAPLGAPMTGPAKTIWSLAFAPDGRTLAAGSGEGKIWLWNTADPRKAGLWATLPAHAGSVFTVAFDERTGILYSGGGDRTSRMWDTDPARVAIIICATVGDPITRAEWARYVPDRPYQPPC